MHAACCQAKRMKLYSASSSSCHFHSCRRHQGQCSCAVVPLGLDRVVCHTWHRSQSRHILTDLLKSASRIMAGGGKGCRRQIKLTSYAPCTGRVLVTHRCMAIGGEGAVCHAGQPRWQPHMLTPIQVRLQHIAVQRLDAPRKLFHLLPCKQTGSHDFHGVCSFMLRVCRQTRRHVTETCENSITCLALRAAGMRTWCGVPPEHVADQQVVQVVRHHKDGGRTPCLVVLALQRTRQIMLDMSGSCHVDCTSWLGSGCQIRLKFGQSQSYGTNVCQKAGSRSRCTQQRLPPGANVHTSVDGTTLKAWKPRWRPSRCTTVWIAASKPALLAAAPNRVRVGCAGPGDEAAGW